MPYFTNKKNEKSLIFKPAKGVDSDLLRWKWLLIQEFWNLRNTFSISLLFYLFSQWLESFNLEAAGISFSCCSLRANSNNKKRLKDPIIKFPLSIKIFRSHLLHRFLNSSVIFRQHFINIFSSDFFFNYYRLLSLLLRLGRQGCQEPITKDCNYIFLVSNEQ